jgi:hypothetical protein
MRRRALLLFITLIVIILTLSAYAANGQEDASMNIVKGLAPAISQYNDLEQTLIKKVSERLGAKGYPIKELTRVYLKNRINSKSEYYGDNEIVFIINPAIYKSSGYINPVESITLRWEDSTVTYTPDGGMELEIGRKVTEEDLVLTLYGVQDAYTFSAPLEDQETVFNKINEIFLACESDEIKHLTSNGLPELLVNHRVVIIQNSETMNEYEVIIGRIGSGVLDASHFHEVDTQYSINVDLNNSSLRLLDKFYPSFYPTPSSIPSKVKDHLF